MKIDEAYQQGTLISNSAESSATKNSETNGANPHVVDESQKSNARIDLSSKSLEISKTKEMMEAEPLDRVEKVNQIKTMVARGEYHVDAKKVADKLLQEGLFDLLKP
jgi:flagellar biosynthesis anti-sigma factor FlgM